MVSCDPKQTKSMSAGCLLTRVPCAGSVVVAMSYFPKSRLGLASIKVIASPHETWESDEIWCQNSSGSMRRGLKNYKEQLGSLVRTLQKLTNGTLCISAPHLAFSFASGSSITFPEVPNQEEGLAVPRATSRTRYSTMINHIRSRGTYFRSF